MQKLKENRPGLGRSAGNGQTTEQVACRSYCTTGLSPLLDAALGWLERGVTLVPLQFHSKRIVRGYGSHQKQVTTPGEAWYWWGEHQANLGLVCGGLPGLVVLDFDWMTEYETFKSHNQAVAQTYTVKTSRGWHCYFWVGDLPSGKVGKVEVKGSGSVIMAAPSVSQTGWTYRPLVEGAPILRVDPENLPLLSGLSRERRPGGIVERVRAAVTGRGDLVGRVKAAWPVLDLAQSLTKLTSLDGRWWHGRCPFHQERNASFWVDAERGVFGCFACGVRGDVINLYARIHGLDVTEAIREMARRLG